MPEHLLFVRYLEMSWSIAMTNPTLQALKAKEAHLGDYIRTVEESLDELYQEYHDIQYQIIQETSKKREEDV